MKEKIIALARKNYILALLFVNAAYYLRWCFGHRDWVVEYVIDNYSDYTNYPARIVKDVMYCKYIEAYEHLDEYFMFGFDKKKRKNRKDYVSTAEYKSYFTKLKKMIKKNVFKDKYNAYQVLNEFYKRDCIKVESFDDYASFVTFATNHNEFLLKELEGSLGQGIAKITINDDTNIKELFFQVLQKSPCILEEYIIQCDELSRFNSNSVNTVRFAMYTNNDGSITDIYSMFRTGVGDAVVDNASNGGIACAVDTETGIVISNGLTKKCQQFVEHPESHIKYMGYQIPRWDELKQTCYEASKLVPEYKMIGWDMALTDDGWVVVEANSRPNINTIQMCLGHGLRDRLEPSLFKEFKNL